MAVPNSSHFDDQSVLLRDVYALKKAYRHAQKNPDALQQYQTLLQQSQTALKIRQAISLNIDYPQQLPISQKRKEIADLIEKHPVVIVAGETGSGKTTQLAKICLELGRGRRAMIGHTQPRRIAAISVANRISEELHCEADKTIAYQVRFDDQSHENTLVKLMTDGVLLAEIAHDRFLEKYDTLIIDEAHERSLNIDFLLGYLKQLLTKRPDLKIIITSATIDVARFSDYFSKAPIISVSGRSFPIDILYRPLLDNDNDAYDTYQGVVQALEEIEQLEYAGKTYQRLGDVLVFLAGEQDIRHCALALRKANLKHCDILPLYGRLPRSEQQKIFNPSKNRAQRRVILATNVAETSLTVPGIDYVIDSGLARISHYSHKSKVQRLPIEKISQASANQRAGRCARLAPGICFRLYDVDDFNLREDFTEPEIKRTNLASVILQMHILQLGDIHQFDFIESPDPRLINDGIRQLNELAALDANKRLTAMGKQMAALPVDPKLARILLAANQYRSLNEALIIIAALSIQDPRETPSDKRQAAREKHAMFKDPQSDFISLLNLWSFIEQQRQNLSQNGLKKLCKEYFLSFVRIKEWRETHRQLKAICHNLKFKENQQPADYASLHKALLSGFLLNVGFQHEKGVFTGTRQRQFKVFPGSLIANKATKWIMGAELIETSQLFAHFIAKIEPEWLLELAKHLLKYQYHQPYFSSKQGQVLAKQEASLYGLVITDKTSVSFSQINPALCREIFIRSALVEQQMQSSLDFYQHNKKLRQDIETLEEKSRRRDLLVNDDKVFDFYQSRLPQTIFNQQGLTAWYKNASADDKKALFASQSLFSANDLGQTPAQFPNYIQYQEMSYQLSYRFEPGHKDDGVSVNIPLASLNRTPHFLFDYLVPGMLQEKCEALLRSLNKTLRKQLAPIPDTAAKLCQKITAQNKALTVLLSDLIKQEFAISVPLEAWQTDKLDAWYQMNFRLLDEKNHLIEQSRDLASLIQNHSQNAHSALKQQAPKLEQPRHFTQWQFDDLTPIYQFKQAGMQLTAYPAIKDETDKVSLQLNDYAHSQAAMHQRGLSRLAILSLPQQAKYLRKNLLTDARLQLQLGTNFNKEDLLDDALMAVFQETFFAKELVWTKQSFDVCLEKNRSQLTSNAQKLESLLKQIIEQAYLTQQAIKRLESQKQHYALTLEDIKKQQHALFGQHFIRQTPWQYLYYYPRYLKAIEYRIDRINPNEKTACQELDLLYQRYYQTIEQQALSASLPAMQEYRWLLEEYRVSLFAQQLKTASKVSKKRLDNLWQDISQSLARDFL